MERLEEIKNGLKSKIQEEWPSKEDIYWLIVQAEKVEQYKKAIKAFEDEFAYECHWQIQNAQGQSRWHKGALEGFNHVKRIFNKYFE